MNDTVLAPMMGRNVFRYTDVDAFRSSVRGLNVDFTPLARKISAELNILNLPGCAVNYTRSFPRIIDAQLDPDCTHIGFTMDDGVPIRFNGEEEDRPVIVVGSGGALLTQVEQATRSYASIVFSPQIDNRGWPQSGMTFKPVEISGSAHQALRALILRVVSVSPDDGDAFEFAGFSAGIRELLLAAVDDAFAEAVHPPPGGRADSIRQFKVFRDVEAALADDIAMPLYSGDLSRQLGVSVRTIHDAVKRYRGMSLHRYLRLRRLWLVRKRLLEGSQSVKACALAFGFWHLGDFSRSYRSRFGEAPSETLARSRR